MPHDALTTPRLGGGAEPIPELLTKKLILRHFLPVGARTLNRMISDGRFPAPDKSIGGKLRLWKVETVRDWIDQDGDEAAGSRGPE